MKSTQLGSISREWPAFCGRSICRWLGTHRGTEWVSSRRWASLASEGMPSTSSSVSSTRQGFCENFRIYDLFLFTWTFHGHYLHAVICMQLLLTGASIKEEIQRWWWRRWTLGWPFFKKINSVWYQNELLGAISLFHLCKISGFYVHYCRLHSLMCTCFWGWRGGGVTIVLTGKRKHQGILLLLQHKP